MRCFSESFPKCYFLFVFYLCVSSDSSVGCLKSLQSVLLVCVLYILSRFDFVGQGFLSLEFPISLSSFFRCFYAFLYLSSIFFLPVNFYMCFFSCSFMFCLTNSNRINSNLDLCWPRLVLYFLIRQHCVSVSRSMLHILWSCLYSYFYRPVCDFFKKKKKKKKGLCL